MFSVDWTIGWEPCLFQVAEKPKPEADLMAGIIHGLLVKHDGLIPLVREPNKTRENGALLPFFDNWRNMISRQVTDGHIFWKGTGKWFDTKGKFRY